jgi:hypothetical protein
MNEETILEKRPAVNNANAVTEIKDKKQSNSGSWKHVTLGGVSGILMGAGLLYGGQVTARELDKPDGTTEDPVTENAQASDGGLQVAATHDEMSVGEAFAAARAEVGPGGVFHWHGGIYNTYTAEEWNSMTPEQKHDFAQQVQPEIDANHVSVPTDAHPDVAVHPAADTTTHDDDVHVASDQTADASDADVHIVGYAEVDGHLAVGLDMDNDGQADVAIIDVDDSGDLSNPDVVIDSNGNAATYGDIVNTPTPDPNMMASMDNPDVAPDMPDYMNDAFIDA